MVIEIVAWQDKDHARSLTFATADGDRPAALLDEEFDNCQPNSESGNSNGGSDKTAPAFELTGYLAFLNHCR